MSSSDALVIWMFRIAMNAPIIAANTAIQIVGLARSTLAGAVWAAPTLRDPDTGLVRARVDMTSPLRVGVGDPRSSERCRGVTLARHRFNGRDNGHAGAQLDRRAAFERDLHRDSLHHLG